MQRYYSLLKENTYNCIRKHFLLWQKSTSPPAGETSITRKWCRPCVLVLPCGRSAHTEAGWMCGAGRRVIAYIPEMGEPELMYKLFDAVVGSQEDLLKSI